MNNEPGTFDFIEDNDQTRARREHLQALAALVGNVYPNKYERSRVFNPPHQDTITAVVNENAITKLVGDEVFDETFASLRRKAQQGEKPTPEETERANNHLNKIHVRLAGRLAVPPRVMGKAAFVHLSDGVSRLQIYVRKTDVTGVRNDNSHDPVDGWQLFNLLDHGDFIGVAGYLFVTKTGELSVHVGELQFLAKALVPMPDKMHGISDPEIRQRRRYAELLAGSLKIETETGADEALRELSPRETFERRAKLIREMRHFLDEHGFTEVETPMLTPVATGAAARPFVTHHNALDITLYARIAPELYLKRLLVGGFERVYELNRNFRNEGIDRTHNPEFTMLEFYAAYWDVNRMMDFCEEMLRTVVKEVNGSAVVKWGNEEFDFSEIERFTMKEAIIHRLKLLSYHAHVDHNDIEQLGRPENQNIFARFLDAFEKATNGTYQIPYGITLAWQQIFGDSQKASRLDNIVDDSTHARQVEAVFGFLAELSLNQPTFITDFPKLISPLSKASPTDPTVAERFELFVAGMECANGFSELNDPVEQHERFVEQMKERERGDEEAMRMDEDYLRALSYGMPPAAGIGIGIDRLVMLLTGKQSIRDVILFPHMRPERKADDQTEDS